MHPENFPRHDLSCFRRFCNFSAYNCLVLQTFLESDSWRSVGYVDDAAGDVAVLL